MMAFELFITAIDLIICDGRTGSELFSLSGWEADNSNSTCHNSHFTIWLR